MYKIKKVDHRITCKCDEAWASAEAAKVNIRNWDIGGDAPDTEARLLWSDYGIHVRMETDEAQVLARETRPNGECYKDSCMEFFLRPKLEDERYINLEFNPFGTTYFAVRKSREEYEFTKWGREDFGVKTKVTEGKWVLLFTIPFEILDELFGKHDKVFFGNLYKCGEDTAVEHYASYYPIKSATPDFHLPEYFGEFMLEE